MSKIMSCFVLLFLVAANVAALADTFKCTRPDGSIFFTDDPSQVPMGCIVERVTEVPAAGALPDAPLPSPAPSEEQSTLPQTNPEELKSFSTLKMEAANLVEKFQAARHRVATESFVTDQLKARRELADIRMQKEGLLREINQSSLNSSEKGELQSLLSPIAD